MPSIVTIWDHERLAVPDPVRANDLHPEHDVLIGKGIVASHCMQLPFKKVSRKHARVRFTSEGQIFLEDLASSNGTLLFDLHRAFGGTAAEYSGAIIYRELFLRESY